MSDTLSLFATAASPVLQAGLIAAAGAGMAWQGALDSHGCSVVAALCFYVFTPALTFSTLAAAISFNSIRHLWPLLANMTISSFIGLAIGQLAATLLQTPVEFRKLVVVSIAFGNVGNLPLVFVGALCGDARAVFQKALGQECVPLGIAYTAFDICVATLFQFTLAIYLLKPPRDRGLSTGINGNHNGGGSGISGGGGISGGHTTSRNFETALDSDYQVVVDHEQLEDEQIRLVSHHNHNHQNQYNNQEAGQSLGGGSTSSGRLHKDPTLSDLLHPHNSPNNNNKQPTKERERGTTTLEIEGATQERNVNGTLNFNSELDFANNNYNNSKASKLKEWLCSIDWKAAFPVPTQAAFGGVLVGCIPPIKHLFYGSANPPLRPVAEALELLGQGLIPGAIPLLGAVLYRGPGRSQLPARVTVGVVLVRLVLQPVLLTGMVVLALKLKFFTAPDPMFLLTLLLANATPTAINMQTLTVLYKFGAEEMSQILFFQYLASLITLPGFVWLFLKIIHAYVGPAAAPGMVGAPP